jgi:hypothetical protein
LSWAHIYKYLSTSVLNKDKEILFLESEIQIHFR